MDYAEGRLREFNDTAAMRDAVIGAVSPARFKFESDRIDVGKAVEYLNALLPFDGYKLTKSGLGYAVVELDGRRVSVPEKLSSADPEHQVEVGAVEPSGPVPAE